MQVSLLDPQSPTWTVDVDRLYARLGGAENPHLFPYHFFQIVLTQIGGHVALIGQEGVERAVALLFPRSFQNGQATYTGRIYPFGKDGLIDWSVLQATVQDAFEDADIVWYDPAQPQPYEAIHRSIGGVDIGRPDAAEAAIIRSLQQQIWGNPPEFLYPVAMHNPAFGLGTSLVARVDGQTAGFLFGFTKFGGSPLPADWNLRFGGGLRLESQTMGVLPAYRGLRLGYLLKKVQSEDALASGVRLINWTVDPLQYPNAALNFGLLRAVTFNFTPHYYPFRNKLNRVPASRFSLTWLIDSARVRTMPLIGATATVVDLRRQPIVRINDGWHWLYKDADTRLIAIEIPTDWTILQHENLDEALRWRTVTDQIFAHYIGRASGQYVVTDIGVDGDRRFLIAERADDALWARLGEG